MKKGKKTKRRKLAISGSNNAMSGTGSRMGTPGVGKEKVSATAERTRERRGILCGPGEGRWKGRLYGGGVQRKQLIHNAVNYHIKSAGWIFRTTKKVKFPPGSWGLKKRAGGRSTTKNHRHKVSRTHWRSRWGKKMGGIIVGVAAMMTNKGRLAAWGYSDREIPPF